MRIFVTGATGYIGSAVAGALARAGHRVKGLVRSPEKARALAAAEIEPVNGDLAHPTGYHEAARSCEVLVHCAAESSPRYFDLDRLTIENLLAAGRESGRPALFVYTSGVWVYGNTGASAVDESSSLNPPAVNAPRVAHERLVLAANGHGLRTVVLRPGCVYGGSGGLTGAWFASAAETGAARLIGDGAQRWAMAHVADVADAYVRAIESPFGGEVFNVTDRSRFTVRECAEAASRAAGGEGRVVAMTVSEASAATASLHECFALDQHVDSSKAVRWLGWQPRHGGFVDGVARYFAAWKAAAIG
jgi:nucleoside-diphosphate-sugar epimerase